MKNSMRNDISSFVPANVLIARFPTHREAVGVVFTWKVENDHSQTQTQQPRLLQRPFRDLHQNAPSSEVLGQVAV